MGHGQFTSVTRFNHPLQLGEAPSGVAAFLLKHTKSESAMTPNVSEFLSAKMSSYQRKLFITVVKNRTNGKLSLL